MLAFKARCLLVTVQDYYSGYHRWGILLLPDSVLLRLWKVWFDLWLPPGTWTGLQQAGNSLGAHFVQNIKAVVFILEGFCSLKFITSGD